MGTNTMVLTVVAALAALVLVSVFVLVAYKTRTHTRHGSGQPIRDHAEDDVLRLRRQEALADEFDARAHAAQVEIDIKTAPACTLQAMAFRSEAVTSRDHLNELRVHRLAG
jgi:hypothetical protein